MFHYRLARASEFPSLVFGHPWPGLLSVREQHLLAGLVVLPRRRKWLLGRAAAKRLVREAFGERDLPEDEISVLNQPSGEPFVLVEGRGGWDRAISISHRSEIGLAAAPTSSAARIGVDVETIEPRDPALVRQFFTDREALAVDRMGASGKARDELVTRIWSAKEAVLKVVGLGLRIDTRSVEVGLAGEPCSDCPAGFASLEVQVIASLPRRDLLDRLRVVWRCDGDHILTVAVAE